MSYHSPSSKTPEAATARLMDELGDADLDDEATALNLPIGDERQLTVFPAEWGSTASVLSKTAVLVGEATF